MGKSYTENMLDWLVNAHSAEQYGEELFSSQIERNILPNNMMEILEGEVKAMIKNQEMLSIRIQQLGGGSSAIKDAAAIFKAIGQSAFDSLKRENIIEDSLCLFNFNQGQIGTYTVIASFAALHMDSETEKVARIILEQYKVRSILLEEKLKIITAQFYETNEFT